jgi:hypothetical protein
MSRADKVSELLQMASRESAVLQDALAECIQLLRRAATGSQIAGEADMTLKQFTRRDLIDRHTYSDVDRLIAVLNSTEPPPGMTPVFWDNAKAVRQSFGRLADTHADYAGLAMTSEAYRNIFVTELVKQHGSTLGTAQIAGLVFKVFAVATR